MGSLVLILLIGIIITVVLSPKTVELEENGEIIENSSLEPNHENSS